MRILALRGSNLASLQGDFAVDLRAGLGGAGLFAITGPTGAGKSTLLDALCLALFDATPRLDTRATARIGREGEEERLPAQDVRSLLRRGCAQGFAEVDFEGFDHRGYRARWTVRRARDKADGRLQASEVTLQDLESGRFLGDSRKTATLQEIEARLGGLTFQQFRRSVLLAQGDFAAFLKATGPERAELLERMTGTDIYTRLSKASHERARQEREVLDRLQAEAGAVSLLPSDEREALEARLAEGRQELAGAEEAVREAEAAVTWHRALADLLRAESEAAALAEQAGQSLAQAAPLREELSAVEAAEPLRDQVREVDDSARELQAAEAAVESARALEAERAAAHESLQSDHAQAEQGRAAAITARDAALPDLARARILDGQLVQADSALARATEEARRAAEAASRATKEAAAGERQVAEAERTRREAEDWLHEKEGLAELVRQWDRWKSCLARFREAQGAWSKAEEARPGLEEGAEHALRAAAEAEQQVAVLREALRAADQERKASQAAAEALAAEPLRQEREALDARLRLLDELDRLAADAHRCRREEQEARADADRFAAEAQAAEARAAAQASRAEGLAPRLEEARHARDRILASLDLVDRRAGLRPGEPCPLCGSEEHPYATGAPGATLAHEQAARVAELEEQLGAAQAEQQGALESARLRRQSAADSLAKADRSAAEAAGHEAGWAARGTGEPDLPPLAAGALDQRRRAVSDRRQELAAREAEALRLAEAARKASDGHERLRKEVDGAVDAHHRVSEQVRKAEEACQANGRVLEAAHQAREAAVAELAGAFSSIEGWELHLRREPARFEVRCLERVEEWSRREAERKQADVALADLLPRVASARAAAEAARGEAARQEAVQAEARTSLERLRGERSRLLSGRGADEVERELGQAVEGAERVLRDLQVREAAAKAARQEASGRLQTSLAEAARRQVLRDEAGTRLGEALARAGLDEAELRRRLGRDAEWRREVRERLQVLEAGVQEARIRLHEREQARRRHESENPPALAAEAAEEARSLRVAGREEIRAGVARVQAALEQDSANRLRQAERLARVEAQRETWSLWEGLREVIGSADGKRFRVFAQSLTLEALLTEANEHLRELAPRYRLERVPPPRDAGGRAAEDHLEIQVVDKDMGDTVRSVQSLSGGESFLVSLALALGLSALAAERARIDSLFIDEGFGSLDAETLETALSCLESLQAGGRQVGIISHVPGLGERIGARVRVEPLGGGRSRVIVEPAGVLSL